MAEIMNHAAFLLMQSTFAFLMFCGCYFSYIIPIRILQRKKSGHQPIRPMEQTVDSIDPSLEDLNNAIDDTYVGEEKAERFIGYCNCFGAGVFVSVCFMAVLPLVREEFEEYFHLIDLQNVHYPVAEFTSLIGFFLVLLLEEFFAACTSRKKKNNNPVLYVEEGFQDDEGLRDGLLVPGSEATDSAFEELKLEDGIHSSRSHGSHPHTHSHVHSHSHSHVQALHSSGFSFFILMFATSIHSIFEGLALGLIREYNKAVHLFIGIILHECIVAVALGLNSFSIKTSPSDPTTTSAEKFGILFSATIPCGIVVGVILGYAPGAFGRLISAIFQGIAAGTFLHVTFCELIPTELNTSTHSQLQPENDTGYPNPVKSFCDKRIFRILLILIGFVFMSIVTLFIDH